MNLLFNAIRKALMGGLFGIRSPSYIRIESAEIPEPKKQDDDPECGLPFVTVPERLSARPEFRSNNWRRIHGYPMIRRRRNRHGIKRTHSGVRRTSGRKRRSRRTH